MKESCKHVNRLRMVIESYKQYIPLPPIDLDLGIFVYIYLQTTIQKQVCATHTHVYYQMSVSSSLYIQYIDALSQYIKEIYHPSPIITMCSSQGVEHIDSTNTNNSMHTRPQNANWVEWILYAN